MGLRKEQFFFYKQVLGFEGFGGAPLPKLPMSAIAPSPPYSFKLLCPMINHFFVIS